MTRPAHEISLRMMVTADEHPELFRALICVADRRRRTRRFKDLATKGLLMELLAGGELRITALTGPVGTPVAPAVKESVSEQLEWADAPTTRARARP